MSSAGSHMWSTHTTTYMQFAHPSAVIYAILTEWTVHACGLWIVREDTPPPARAPCRESDILCAPGIFRFLPPSYYVRDSQCWVASKRTYTLKRSQCTQTDTAVKYPRRNSLQENTADPQSVKYLSSWMFFMDVLC